MEEAGFPTQNASSIVPLLMFFGEEEEGRERSRQIFSRLKEVENGYSVSYMVHYTGGYCCCGNIWQQELVKPSMLWSSDQKAANIMIDGGMYEHKDRKGEKHINELENEKRRRAEKGKQVIRAERMDGNENCESIESGEEPIEAKERKRTREVAREMDFDDEEWEEIKKLFCGCCKAPYSERMYFDGELEKRQCFMHGVEVEVCLESVQAI